MKKILSIVVCMLICLSSILIIPDEREVKASGGGQGGSEGELDYEYLESQIDAVAHVIYTAYELGDIRKGRFFGSKGGEYTCNEIIIKQMNNMDINNVRTEEIGEVEGLDVYYNRTQEVIGYNLTVNINGENKTIPKCEVFPVPSVKPCGDGFNYPHEFDGIGVIHQNFRKYPPLDEWYESSHEVTGFDTYDSDFTGIAGVLEYISDPQQVPDPDDQEGMVYLFNKDGDSQDIIDNLTKAFGVVLANTSSFSSVNVSSCPYQVKEINESEGDILKSICENNSDTIIDTYLTDNITVYYDVNETCCPESNYFILDKIPDHNELKNDNSGLLNSEIVMGKDDPYPHLLHYMGCVFFWQIYLSIRNWFLPDCLGIILYSEFDHYFMPPTHLRWDERDVPLHEKYKLNKEGVLRDPSTWGWSFPMFCINQSIGNDINNSRENTLIYGDIHQKYYEGTSENPGMIAHNAIGELNIDKSPNDEYIIISNRYDGMWGETPGDSGIGTAIVLALARHQKNLQENHSVDPKRNITYLFTTGEEIGFRGAYFHRDNLTQAQHDRIHMWIGFDQLGMDQSDVTFNPELRSPENEENNALTYYKVLWAIANMSDYDNKSEYEFKPSVETDVGGSEDFVWGEKITDTIVFVRDSYRAWDRWHATGENYTNGDSLDYTDSEQVNLTYKIAWEFVKYICYDPHCWFDSLSRQNFDSSTDSDELSDSINASFTIKAKFPYDIAFINASLKNKTTNESVANMTVAYNVTSNQINGSIILTVPEDKPAGLYELYLELYNSTGRIERTIGQGDNYNDTSGLHLYYYLYPFSPDIPEIVNVTDNPDTVGFGHDITIEAEVFNYESGIDNVNVNITYSDDSCGNFSMSDMGNDTYQYIFSDTWLVGQYNYTIWATDSVGYCNSSSGHSLNVSAQATIEVCSFKDNYGSDEFINLTDPPINQQLIGYELLDEGDVFHIWNNYNSYYFNTSSGIQLTNHYNEYWSHNVLMLGYYNNGQWNLIYRTDELSGFTKNVVTDNETFVNATLWKDLTYQGYDFRLAIRYHLGLDDADLTIIPYIKNLGDAIPFDVAFGWEIKDIKIADTYENDWIRLYNGMGWEEYQLNQTLDKQYTDMDKNTTFYLEGRNEDQYFKRTLYMNWNDSLNYMLKVKSRENQYNSPVTLFIKVGTLDEDQEKSTLMHWLDSDEWLGISSSELDSYCGSDGGQATLENALDGTFFWQHSDTETHWFIIDLGETYAVKKVRGRSLTYTDPTDVNVYVSDSKTSWGSAVASGISTWKDTPIWQEVDTTDKNGRYVKVEIDATEDTRNSYIEFGSDSPPFTIFDIYGDVANVTPVSYDAYPENGSTNISTSPTLNITVSDPNGDNMDITWYSNSSGSWIAFGTNNSVGNGTYHQIFSNVSNNGQWWYWKVNVTDGTNYAEESIYKFYTGFESKINNTGSTHIKGYLLIQVQYLSNGTTWIVVNDTINETSPRTILWADPMGTPGQNIFALDTIFNGIVNTSNLPSASSGTYRIYAAFRDPNGNVLICDDEMKMEATYEFSITFE